MAPSGKHLGSTFWITFLGLVRDAPDAKNQRAHTWTNMKPKNTKTSQDSAKKSLLRAILTPSWHHFGGILAALFDHLGGSEFLKNMQKNIVIYIQSAPEENPPASWKIFRGLLGAMLAKALEKLFFESRFRCLLAPSLAPRSIKLEPR